MKLWVDCYCEIADLLAPWTDQQFYQYADIVPETGTVYVVGRTQLKLNAAAIRQHCAQGHWIVYSNPAEGSVTFDQHCVAYGVADLVASGALPTVTGAAAPWPHLLWEHFLTQPLRFAENTAAAGRAAEIFQHLHKPYTFLYLNGRDRPHRRALMQDLQQQGLLEQALWTNLDSAAGAIRTLPQGYEVDRYQHCVRTVPDTGFVKSQLFDSEWGDIYLQFDAYRDTYFSVVAETVWDTDRSFRTEKIAKPLCQGHPFIVAATAGYYRDLHNLGFQTFGSVIDESFDTVEDSDRRRAGIVATIGDLVRQQAWPEFLGAVHSICKYNQQRLAELHASEIQQFPQRFFDYIHDRFRISPASAGSNLR